ncbi:MAG TPA: isoprenyl transferase [Anaerolineae bacterium]|nr:isoprenyl transferase [Anaerolineae bacterium]
MCGRGDSERAGLVRVPRHVAIIMDGNGRWARARGLPRVAGHRAGTESLRRVLRAAIEFGIEILTIYAFSTENWERPQQEVRALMGLVEHVVDSEIDELNENGVKIRHVGRVQGLAPRLLDKIRDAQELTKQNSRLVLNVAFNYGGRAEIVDAVREIVVEGLPPDQIDERAISRRLATAGLPDPDLVIRTGGEMRLSNFLVWQSAYAEFYSTPTFWPDFDRNELHKALLAYQQRDRRFGRLGAAPE